MSQEGAIRFVDSGEENSSDALQAPCPLRCDSDAFHKVTIQLGGASYDLFDCEKCGSNFYHPLPVLDYETCYSDLTVRHYVEIGAGIESIATYLLPALRPSVQGAMLDVGCGFGFSLDLAKRIRGWDVFGVEPGLQAELGASHLGVSIERCMLKDSEQLRNHSFDVVFSSEVLEHLEDPLDFLNSLKQRLKSNGILVLTTPDASAVVPDAPYHQLIPILSPGGHVILFSEYSLRMILRKVGFSHVQIKRRGATLLAYAGVEPFRLANYRISAEVDRYYQSHLEDSASSDWLKWGIAYRALRDKVNHGQYGLAKEIAGHLEVLPFDENDAIANMEELGERFPFCYPCLLYYLAMLRLNFSKVCNEETAQLFQKAFLLLRLKLKIMPNFSPEESKLVWKAKAHEGIAWARMGDRDAANGVLRFMSDMSDSDALSKREPSLPLVPAGDLKILSEAIAGEPCRKWLPKPLAKFLFG